MTRVDLDAFEQRQVWGDIVYHDISTMDQQLREFSDLSSALDYDEYASLITSFSYAPGTGAAVINNVVYTRLVENLEPPPVLAALMRILSLYSTVRLAGMVDIFKEQGLMVHDGIRQLSALTTYGTTMDMLKATYTPWNQTLGVVDGIVRSISLEPLQPAIYDTTQHQMPSAWRTGPAR
jgi:hypothetical protein